MGYCAGKLFKITCKLSTDNVTTSNTNHIICYFNIYFKNYISPTRQQPHLHRGITAAKTAKSVTRHNAIEPEASKLIKSIIVFGNCSCTVSQTSSMKYYAPAPANKIVKKKQ